MQCLRSVAGDMWLLIRTANGLTNQSHGRSLSILYHYFFISNLSLWLIAAGRLHSTVHLLSQSHLNHIYHNNYFASWHKKCPEFFVIAMGISWDSIHRSCFKPCSVCLQQINNYNVVLNNFSRAYEFV